MIKLFGSTKKLNIKTSNVENVSDLEVVLSRFDKIEFSRKSMSTKVRDDIYFHGQLFLLSSVKCSTKQFIVFKNL